MTESAPRSENQGEARDERIAQLFLEVEEIADRLGSPVDEGIKETVVYCLAHDLPTEASCEGHVWSSEQAMEGAGPSVAPWVDIGAPEPEADSEQEKMALWKRENAKLQVKVLTLLDEFYVSRQAAADTRLILIPVSEEGAFRVTNQGNELMMLLPPEKQVERQPAYQREMRDFTAFLKRRYEG